eukprot:1759602-Pyramimonas_sp.AAC.1
MPQELDECRLTVLPAGKRYPRHWKCRAFVEYLHDAGHGVGGPMHVAAAAACSANDVKPQRAARIACIQCWPQQGLGELFAP